MSSNDFDWDGVDPGAQDEVALSFPVVMWRNGSSDLEALGEDINHVGGFFFTYEHAGDGTSIKGWKEASFKGDRGKVPGIAAHKAMVSFIRGRKRWFRQMNDHTEYRAWGGYEPGFRAQMQIIGFVKGYENPVCFSFKGLNVNNVESIRREHAKVLAIVNRSAPEKGVTMPAYALWTVIDAGPHEMVGKGQQSEATPPRICLPKELNLDVARSLYVGRDLLLASQNLYRELDQWAHEWDRFGAAQDASANDSGVTPEDAREALAAAAFDAQAPASQRPAAPATGDFDEDPIPF